MAIVPLIEGALLNLQCKWFTLVVAYLLMCTFKKPFQGPLKNVAPLQGTNLIYSLCSFDVVSNL